MIVPTIGRVVLVNVGKSSQMQPALVSFVHTPTCINVGGFDQYGNHFFAISIQLLQDDDKPVNPTYYAEWMPYQKKAALEHK